MTFNGFLATYLLISHMLYAMSMFRCLTNLCLFIKKKNIYEQNANVVQTTTVV